MNDLIPGKVFSDLKSMHICYGGGEHALVDFEVLLNDADFDWVQASNGNVPPNAVIGGQTESGEPLFVARAKHLYLTIPGKFHPSHKCAYVPCDWKEHAKNDYEVLVRKGPAQSPKCKLISKLNGIKLLSNMKNFHFFCRWMG